MLIFYKYYVCECRLLDLTLVEVTIGSWLNIVRSFLHSVLFGFWFGGHTNWLLEKLQLDTKHQIEGDPHFIDGFCNIWSNSWYNLSTYHNWEPFSKNWLPAAIRLVLGFKIYLLGLAILFFYDFIFRLFYLVARIVETASPKSDCTENVTLRAMNGLFHVIWQISCSVKHAA